MLVQQDAVHDGQHGVHAVDPEKQEVLDIARGGYEPAQGKEDDEGDAHRAHVSGKAPGTPAEIEETEHQNRQARNIEQRRVDETIAVIEHRQRDEHRQRIRPRDAVDPVHEVVRVDDAHADYQRWDDSPPKLYADETKVHEHQQHRRELHQEPPHVRHRMHVIRKAHRAYRRQPRHEPRVVQPEERGVQPRTHGKDDATAPQRDMGVRAS